MVRWSDARFAVFAHGDRGTRGGGGLHVVFDAAEAVAHVPVIGLALGRRGGAAAHVLDRRVLAAVAAGVGADRRAGDHADAGGDITPGATANLVTQDAAEDAAQHGAADVRARFLRRSD